MKKVYIDVLFGGQRDRQRYAVPKDELGRTLRVPRAAAVAYVHEMLDPPPVVHTIVDHYTYRQIIAFGYIIRFYALASLNDADAANALTGYILTTVGAHDEDS